MTEQKARASQLLRRVAVCIAGMLIYASGVAITKNCAIGISPITSVAYAMSLITGITLGWCTTLQNLAFLSVQRLLLKREYTLKTMSAQLAMSVLFSLCIDFTAWVWRFVQPTGYASKVAVFVAGCGVLALGMCLVMRADFVVLPAEGAVIAIAGAAKVKFGTVKICFDAAMVAITALLSLVCLGRVAGVGLGTVLAVLLIGSLARFISPFLKKEG